MQDWQEQWDNMRAQFVARAEERVGRVEVLLNEMTRSGTADLLTQVRHHFHWLSGVGGTYKLPEISDIGVQGEQLCDQHLDAGSLPDDSAVKELQSLLLSVKRQLKAAANSERL